MNLLFKLAWRNIWRNRRRTIITIVAVVFATLLSIATRGFQLGTYEKNISYALGLFSGSFQLQAPGFSDNPTLHESFREEPALYQLLDAESSVKGYAPRVYADGLVSFGNNSLGAALFGIRPGSEAGVTTLLNKIVSGRMFMERDTFDVVLGHKLLKNLKAEIGDRIVVLAQGYDGSLGNMKFRVSGTLKTGSDDLDLMAVLLNKQALQELLSMPGRISVMAVAVDNLDEMEETVENLNAGLDTAAVRALPWTEVMPDLKQSIELDNVSGIFFLGILIVVVAFGILNTVLMSVTERFREFGIQLSMGMPQSKLVLTVLIETIFISIIGLLIGNILGYVVNAHFTANPIEFTGDYADMMREYGFLPVMASTVRASSFLNTTLSIFGISILSSIYPLYRVYILEPLKGIRYT